LRAIEELVVNSYDADASNCYVSIQPETIAVVDDGIGMDLVGRQLGKPLTVDMILGAISQDQRVKAVQVTNAIRSVAKASKGLVRLSRDGSEVIILGAFEELRRRLGTMISARTPGRLRGSFRKAADSQSESS
jgi:predicted phosphoribosyltransferase